MLGLLLVLGCKGCAGVIDLGQGPESDARFTADVYTWPCQDASTGDEFQGVFAFDVALEYAPDGLQDRQLPGPGGCAYGLTMFPENAGDGGTDVPEMTQEPHWSTPDLNGELGRVAPGFYYDKVLDDQHSCQSAEELLADGVTLEDAASLSGAVTPPASEIVEPSFDFDDANGNGLPDFGETLQIEWDDHAWDETFIQIRRVRDGEDWGSVTCNAGTADSFSFDENAWSLFPAGVNVETIELYVGFQNVDVLEMDDGQKVEATTRGMAVQVIQE